MINPEIYPNAPITEAIIDIRVDGDLTIETLQSVCGRLEKDYPQSEGLFEASGRLEFAIGGGAASASATSIPTGFKVADKSGRYIAQFQKNGFTLSRLAPYEDWAKFQSEAARIWAIYREETIPAAITRLAVRYINRVDIPQGEDGVNIKDYLRTVPELSPDLTGTLSGYFMQLSFSHHDIRCNSIINQTVIPPAHPGVLSIVLDIDLFRSEDIPVTDVAVWGFFDVLHREKNSIFEACITDLARELFR